MGLFSFKTYALLTIASVGIAIYNSYTIHKQFYPTTIHLSTNKVNRTIFVNFLVMVIIKVLVLFLSFVFGELREIERISVIDRARRKVVDIGLMLLIFREDVDIWFILMMIQLIALSFMHWIPIKRSEYVNPENQMKISLHLKLMLCFAILIIVDYYVCNHHLVNSFSGPSVYLIRPEAKFQDIIFGFEFILLALKMVLPLIKYLINLFEVLTYSHFEYKQTLFSVLDFVFTLAKLTLQLLLINFIRLTYGLPLFLIGDAIENIVGIFKAFQVFFRSFYLVWMIKKYANSFTIRIDDVKADEIKESESMCLICLDEILEGKKLSCGHVFHTTCLRTWIQGNPNQFCPKCKKPIKFDQKKKKKPHDSYWDEQPESDEDEAPTQSKEKQHLKKQQKSTKIVTDLQEIRGTIQVYENVSQLRQLYCQEVQPDHFPDHLGSVAFGLPTEANYRISLKNEIKRLQIRLMNTVMIAIEQGTIDPSEEELEGLGQQFMMGEQQMQHQQQQQQNRHRNQHQQAAVKRYESTPNLEERKDQIEPVNLHEMMHEAALKRFLSQQEEEVQIHDE